MINFKDRRLREKVLNIASVINMFILVASFFAKSKFNIYLIISAIILILLEFILRPLNLEFTEGKFKLSKLLIRAIIFIIFAISLYIIMIGKNYNLKYTYYISITTTTIIIINIFYQGIIAIYKKSKLKGAEKSNLIFVFLMISYLFIGTIYIYNFSSEYNLPEKEIKINITIMPEYLSITKITDDNYDDIFDFKTDKEGLKVTDSQTIEKIVAELNNQSIKNISGIKLLNYKRMLNDYNDKYLIYFNYGGENYEVDTLKKGYIYKLVVPTKRKAFIEELTSRDRFILGEKLYYDRYPVELSKNTIEMIQSYIE